MTQKIDARLIGVAKDALKRSYSPYSQFRVAAAVQMADGKIFSGCNVENASFGATLCAERVAIATAIAQATEKKGRALKKLLVYTKTLKPITPCGLCRQMIVEFAAPDLEIVCANHLGLKKRFTLDALCPQFFLKHNLKGK